jgi:hypothetical protein
MDSNVGMNRRQMIERGALAAGFVWSAPAIRTARALGAPVGSPVPTTTSSTPQLTLYRLDAPIDGWGAGGADVPDCPATEGLRWTFTSVPPDLGSIAIVVDFCGPLNLAQPFGPYPFTLQASAGSVSGTITGLFTIQQPPPPLGAVVFHFDLVIATGTAAFAGATGNAAIDGTSGPFVPFVANLSGSFSA